MGKILAADFILNNHDRIKAIWNNTGTPSTMIFECEINAGNRYRNEIFEDPNNTYINVLSVVPYNTTTNPISNEVASFGNLG